MKQNVLFALFIFLILFSLSSCVAKESAESKYASYANPEAVVSVSWLNKHLGDENLRIIEIGSSFDEYKLEHIPGAVFVNWRIDIVDINNPVENMVAGKEKIEGLMRNLGIKKSDTVVVYDNNGNVLAGRLFWVLKYYNHGDVRFLEGGKKAWRKASFELSSELPEIEKSDYKIDKVNSEYRVTIDYVLSKLNSPGVVIVDVRSPEQYSGEEKLAKRGGHIPGAVNVFWRNTLTQDGLLKTRKELEELYESRGITKDKEVIVYCHSGVLSAYSWFVLHELLGYNNVKLYDGSWVEWGNREDTPVKTGNEP